MNSSEIKASQNQQWINDKIHERCIPTHALPPNLPVRPVPTKYVKLNSVDQHPPCREEKKNFSYYQSDKMFCPTSRNVNYTGYANNIHLENELRNQHYALQKSDQREYVPSSKSTLYNYSAPSLSSMPQSFSYLFDNSIYFPVQNEMMESSKSLFNNHTRYQR
jgi:hypothetical protein